MSEQRAAIETYVSTLGVHYAAEFVPFNKSRNAKSAAKLSELSLNWRVTLSKRSPIDGQTTQQLTTDYQTGIGHIPGLPYNAHPTIHYDACVRHSCEHGSSYVDSSSGVIRGRPLSAPALADVLYCLISDADAIEYPTYEDWASNMGYNTDSRKGEATYRACLEISLKLRALIGDGALTKLRELFQDY